MTEAALSVNGQIVPIEGGHLSALDRGFLLGDGLFETIRVHQARPIRLERHFARLRAGAGVLDLPIDRDDDALARIIGLTLADTDLTEATIRLTISRGIGRHRGLLPDPDPSPTLVVHVVRFDGYPASLYERGMRAIVSEIHRNERSPLATIKSLNYLDNILARRDAAARGADEALLLNTANYLAGASAANVFIVDGERLVTPSLSCGALPGTIRRLVLEHLAESVEERPVTLAELESCEEAFLTNALLGIMPLTVVDGRPIGAGAPGHLTQALIKSLAA